MPGKLFSDPYSTVLESHDGQLLSASIARDGQWRFPMSDTVPDKFITALVTFEDKRFYKHPGVDLLSLGRAARQNVNAGRVVSGGSTITMQVIRLARKGQSRTFFEKIWEIILATRLEIRSSKKEILGMYAAHAPFGGNVVGLEAACWRYFGRKSSDLSWSEAAMLAVLPNAPSLIHPGKNRETLKQKRDALLDQLKSLGYMDAFSCDLAKEEPLPEKPFPLPRHARHLLSQAELERNGQTRIMSSLDIHLQKRVEEILEDHHRRLSGNGIHNAAAIVADVRTGLVLAYAGNVDEDENNNVDIIRAPRSTGSILKPFLYAASLDDGKILPRTLLPDVPTFINGFAPKNFSREYDGAVPADKALIRSLNVPAVYLLKEYRYERFHPLLEEIGMTTLTYPPDHYGLSLILGGAEGTLWDVAGMYASMSRTLMNYFEHPGKNKYDRRDFHPLRYAEEESNKVVTPELTEASFLSAAAIYQTFDALKEVYRPGEESGWKNFYSAKKIAWKTGTSFGFRDGWAVGVTPDYVVGVWIGNADGEGRPGLTGTETAAPVMFDIFSQLQGSRWFQRPDLEFERITVCAKSGFRNTSLCDDIDTILVTTRGLQSGTCPFHRRIHLDEQRQYQVHGACQDLATTFDVSWFVLPPVQEYYYRPRNLSYKTLPPYRKDCINQIAVSSMDIIYPKPHSRIFIPKELNGEPGMAVFELAHRNPEAAVFWHLDGNFVGSTVKDHRMPLNPSGGKHLLTIIDENGEIVQEEFEILSKF